MTNVQCTCQLTDTESGGLTNRQLLDSIGRVAERFRAAEAAPPSTIQKLDRCRGQPPPARCSVRSEVRTHPSHAMVEQFGSPFANPNGPVRREHLVVSHNAALGRKVQKVLRQM